MPGITFEKREDGFNGLFCFATDVRSLTKQLNSSFQMEDELWGCTKVQYTVYQVHSDRDSCKAPAV